MEGEAVSMANGVVLQMFGAAFGVAFAALSYLLVSCRNRRLTAESKLKAANRQMMEWDPKSREFLENDKNSDAGSSLSKISEHSCTSLSSLGASMYNSNGFDAKVLVDPKEVMNMELIGRGGFGNVYRGLWRRTPVAVKVVFFSEANESALQSMVKEADIMSRLRHPNVVLYLGLSILENKTVSIITELMERGSLFHVLHEKEMRPDGTERFKVDLGLNDKLRFAVEACRGLVYLHSCPVPVVHKDFKSLNLLVSESMVVKVSDFGLSSLKKDTLLSANSAGTPEWSAPEVLLNERHGLPCDVYSLGVVIWEIVARKVPFQGLTAAQVISQVAFQHHKLPRAVPDDPLQADFRAVEMINELVEECTKHNQAFRPTATQVLERLEGIQKVAEAEQWAASRAPPLSAQRAQQAQRAAVEGGSGVVENGAGVQNQDETPVKPPAKAGGRRKKLQKLDLRPSKLQVADPFAA